MVIVSFVMLPTSKKLKGHIGLGLSVVHGVLCFAYSQEQLEIGS